MTRRLSSILFLACLVVAWPAADRRAMAQQPPSPQNAPAPGTTDAPPPSYSTPPAITLVDGSVKLVRQGQSQAAVASMPLVEGDRLVTDGGRVEVTFPDGSLLHVDRNATIDFLSMSLMRLREGRVILVASGRGGERASVDYQIDAPAGSARIQTAGEYKFSMVGGEVELDVITGTASLASDQGSVRVEAGERSFAKEGLAPSDADAFNSAQLDDFDRWSESQRETDTAEASGSSAQYLPSDLYQYSSTFDRYGRWESNASYGYVWYPTVSVGWRPYYNGYWDYVGPYGWTWIGHDAWAWPTHHFGRWGFNAGVWFWIPTPYWGPAWVSWGYSTGYYGWCPLNYYNQPIIGLHHHGGYDPWLCWTVTPYHRFGHGYHVPHYAVAGARLPAGARDGFAMRRGGPDAPIAAPRNAGGTGLGGVRAAPRALSSGAMTARPRESAFAAMRATPRAGAASGAPVTAPRADRRSLAFSNQGQRYDRGATPAASAMPRGTSRPPASYDARGSAASRVAPRSVDRPGSVATAPRSYQSAPARSYPSAPPRSGQSAQPRSYQSTPYADRPPSAYGRSGSTAPGRVAPTQPRTDNYSAPRYVPPPARGQANTAPRYSAPSSPRYSAPQYSAPSSRPSQATPRYSAPAAPRYSPPSYSAPRYSPPSYSAPPAQRYSAPSYSAPRSAPSYSAPRSAPSYSAPRSAPPSYSAPRSGGGGAPRSAPPASGGGRRGGR